MSTEELSKENVSVWAKNIGGITETEVSFEPGVTILAGRNATNRTSLLQAIIAGLGSNKASLKGDADEGEVELFINDERYSRTLTRQNGDVVLGGDPYLDNPEVADLFAFLLEENEARRAVARGDDLREIIMRPIDTDAIQAEIEQLESKRRELDKELESLENIERRLPELRSQRASLETEIEEKQTELEKVEEDIEALDANVEETRKERNELETKLDELRDTRAELDRLRQRVEAEEESIKSLTEEREEVEAELESIPTETDVDTNEIEREIERLRERKRTLDSVTGELQNVIQFNEEMLEGDRNDVRSALDVDDEGAITDQLIKDQTVCWTCGSKVEKQQIEVTLDQLRSYRKEKFDAIQTTETRLSELRDELQSVEDQNERRTNLETKLDNIDDELDSRQEHREELREEQESVSEELGTLEKKVDKLENEEFSEILNKHKEANNIEFEIGRLESDLQDANDEIEQLENRIDERDKLEMKREQVKSDLVDARTRIEQIEEQAVEEFNTHIATVLDILEYGNLDRVWIERVERKVREGRRKVERSQFELHLVRTNEVGQAYEDTIDHLSESEREVVGLVFALAGYLVHETYETLPFIVLDSLEAIDSDRIATLVEYFSDYADYSIVALLPEDEQALSDSYHRISNI
jgi:chromosome segregation ATPase